MPSFSWLRKKRPRAWRLFNEQSKKKKIHLCLLLYIWGKRNWKKKPIIGFCCNSLSLGLLSPGWRQHHVPQCFHRIYSSMCYYFRLPMFRNSISQEQLIPSACCVSYLIKFSKPLSWNSVIAHVCIADNIYPENSLIPVTQLSKKKSFKKELTSAPFVKVVLFIVHWPPLLCFGKV